METLKLSVIVPIFKNEGSLPLVVERFNDLNKKLLIEAVFVVDGSPDQSEAVLRRLLPTAEFRSQLVVLGRNFGAFSAVRCGLERARGKYVGVLAADLQEPTSLLEDAVTQLDTDSFDVVFGKRIARGDPFVSRFFSNLFWFLYRTWVVADIPPGGVDIFVCNQTVRQYLVQMKETRSSLIALLYWVGCRRGYLEYERQSRPIGKSAWTLQKKVRYLLDSCFAFSHLPVRLLLAAGLIGITVSLVLLASVLYSKFVFDKNPMGYTALISALTFFGGLNSLGLGIIGEYVWRGYENSKGRPLTIVQSQIEFPLS
jgi:glycosyltransferase involved in cell wall biosynthesis